MPILLVRFEETDRKKLNRLLSSLQIENHLELDRIIITENPLGGHFVDTHVTREHLDRLSKQGFSPTFVQKDLPDPRKYVSKGNRYKGELERLRNQKRGR